MKKTLILCISFICLALVSVGAYVFAYDYLKDKLNAVLMMEVNSVQKDSQSSRQDLVHELFVSTSADREALLKYFVRQDEVALVVERLERLGKEEGVSVEVSGIGVGQQGGSDQSRVYPVDITLQATGPRSYAEAFLRRVELLPTILSIENISFEKLQFVEGKGERWRLAVNFRIGMIR